MAIERTISIRAWEHPRESPPQDLVGLFSEAELAAYADGAPFFLQLAATSGCRQLEELLETADADQPMFVDMKKHGESPWNVWFGFTFPTKAFHPRLRLSQRVDLPPNTPHSIGMLYKSFGGICGSSFIGGFMTPERILLGANHFVMDCHEVRLPDDSYTFFDFGNGDYAGWLPSGDGFMYDHDTGDVSESEFSELWEMLVSQFNRSPFENHFE